MTRDEVIALLQELGIKAEKVTDQLIETVQEKVESEKQKLDTETRRTVRKFWSVVSAAAFLIGVGVGHLFF